MTLDTSSHDDVVVLAQAIADALHAAVDYLEGVDVSLLSSDVQQSVALAKAAGAAVDQLLDALNISDVDSDGGG
jgi:hypothetical protein